MKCKTLFYIIILGIVAVLIFSYRKHLFHGSFNSGSVINIPVHISSKLYRNNPLASCVYVDMTVGTPGQNFRMYLDTGGNWTWVPSSSCGDHKCAKQRRFYSEESSTYKKNGAEGLISYIFGTVYFFLAADSVSLGGLTVADQPFGEATDLRDLFHQLNRDQTAVDGVLGLPPRGPPECPGTSLFITAFEQGLIQQQIFGMYFHKNSSSTEGDDKEFAGELIIGGRDDSKHPGELNLNYAPLIPQSCLWDLTSDGVEFNGKTYGKEEVVNVDSGFPGIMTSLPESALAAAFQQEQYSPMLECSKLSSYPSLTFLLNGHRWEISPQDYIISTKFGCFSALVNGGRWILGVPAHLPFYVEYDFGQQRIGFAKTSTNSD